MADLLSKHLLLIGGVLLCNVVKLKGSCTDLHRQSTIAQDMQFCVVGVFYMGAVNNSNTVYNNCL